MQKLGLIGGMSWQSTAIYYRHLNEIARARLGDLHSADLLLRSLDFADIATRQHDGDWEGLAQILVGAGRDLEKAGAKALVLCTNTMHLLAERIEAAVSIPLIHIADATALAIRQSKSRNPALLATRFTMERDFYRGRLLSVHGLKTVIPDEAARLNIHRIIYEELCEGVVKPESKREYVAEVEHLRQQGADGVIMGCTEITMLIGQDDFDIPVFDTTWLHAEAAMDFALSGTLPARQRAEAQL